MCFQGSAYEAGNSGPIVDAASPNPRDFHNGSLRRLVPRASSLSEKTLILPEQQPCRSLWAKLGSEAAVFVVKSGSAVAYFAGNTSLATPRGRCSDPLSATTRSGLLHWPAKRRCGDLIDARLPVAAPGNLSP
jgi:hypothetical protein